MEIAYIPEEGSLHHEESDPTNAPITQRIAMRIILRLLACVAALMSWPAPPANADLLPLFANDELDRFQNAISGGGSCTTSGGYNVDTFEYEQSHLCDEQLVTGSFGDQSEWSFRIFDERTFLNASIDNNGEVIGSTFSWFGIVPEFGVNELTLLGSGRLLDIAFVGVELGAAGYSALIEFETNVDFGPGIRLDPFVEWYTFTTIGLSDPICIDDPLACNPWSETRDIAPNYTGTNFNYYRRISVPEPGALTLLFIGLSIVFGSNLSRCIGARPRPPEFRR